MIEKNDGSMNTKELDPIAANLIKINTTQLWNYFLIPLTFLKELLIKVKKDIKTINIT